MSHRSHRNQLLLRNHPDFQKECRVFLQKKRVVKQNAVCKRYAKRKWKFEQLASKYQLVQLFHLIQTMSFYRQCIFMQMVITYRPPHLISAFPSQQQFLCHKALMSMKKKPSEGYAALPYTETNKLVYPLISN